jgi:hypothetical protein
LGTPVRTVTQHDDRVVVDADGDELTFAVAEPAVR